MDADHIYHFVLFNASEEAAKIATAAEAAVRVIGFKFSTSNNLSSRNAHWIRYRRCAKINSNVILFVLIKRNSVQNIDGEGLSSLYRRDDSSTTSSNSKRKQTDNEKALGFFYIFFRKIS